VIIFSLFKTSAIDEIEGDQESYGWIRYYMRGSFYFSFSFWGVNRQCMYKNVSFGGEECIGIFLKGFEGIGDRN